MPIEAAFAILKIMNPVIDRGILVFFAGIVLGYLEMSGITDPTQHSTNLDALTNILGAIITVVTIVSFYIHRTLIEKHKIEYSTPVAPPTPRVTFLKPEQPAGVQ